MRKLIAILLVAVMLTLVACRGGGKAMEKPSPAAPPTTEASVSDVDAQIDDLDSLDQELDMSDLDTLDQELDLKDI